MLPSPMMFTAGRMLCLLRQQIHHKQKKRIAFRHFFATNKKFRFIAEEVNGMSRKKIETYLELLNGSLLDDLTLAAQMMMFSFGSIAIHSQCFTRIMHQDRILLTTLDYQNWDEADDKNNDEWYNWSLHKKRIINNKVIKTELTNSNDLFIWLENDIQLQIFVSNGSPHYVEDCEQWRMIDKDGENIPQTVIYSNGIQEE